MQSVPLGPTTTTTTTTNPYYRIVLLLYGLRCVVSRLCRARCKARPFPDISVSSGENPQAIAYFGTWETSPRISSGTCICIRFQDRFPETINRLIDPLWSLSEARASRQQAEEFYRHHRNDYQPANTFPIPFRECPEHFLSRPIIVFPLFAMQCATMVVFPA